MNKSNEIANLYVFRTPHTTNSRRRIIPPFKKTPRALDIILNTAGFSLELPNQILERKKQKDKNRRRDLKRIKPLESVRGVFQRQFTFVLAERQERLRNRRFPKKGLHAWD